jgi:hypothetical protein
MDGFHGMRHLILVSWLAVSGLTGCAQLDMTDPGRFWPFSKEPRTDVVPGLATPAQRVAVLKKLSERASQVGPAEQERIAGELGKAVGREADPSLRAEIIRTLSYYPTRSSGEALRSALNDSDADVRMAACEAWGKRGGAEAVEILTGVVSGDVDGDVRLTAVRALGKTGDPKAAAALSQALADNDPAMQRRVMLSLRDVTGKDFGGDAHKWRQYLNGETPERDNSIWIAEQFRDFWKRF